MNTTATRSARRPFYFGYVTLSQGPGLQAFPIYRAANLKQIGWLFKQWDRCWMVSGSAATALGVDPTTTWRSHLAAMRELRGNAVSTRREA